MRVYLLRHTGSRKKEVTYGISTNTSFEVIPRYSIRAPYQDTVKEGRIERPMLPERDEGYSLAQHHQWLPLLHTRNQNTGLGRGLEPSHKGITLETGLNARCSTTTAAALTRKQRTFVDGDGFEPPDACRPTEEAVLPRPRGQAGVIYMTVFPTVAFTS